jgi:hypothetical protein
MAATAEATRLTEAHRLAQVRIGTDTIRAMFAVWPLLDPDDLDGTIERWLLTLRPVIAAQRTSSARLAANYLTTFKALEVGVGAATPTVLAEALTEEAIISSLTVTGPIRAKQAIARGTPVAKAMETAKATSAFAGMRHALNGGRETTLRTVDQDREAYGWARATSGQPCHFCAMLASRGPVYKGERTADFEAHDHCSCTAEPVYRRDAAWPSGAERFRDMWREAAAADGDTAKNFRHLVQAQ